MRLEDMQHLLDDFGIPLQIGSPAQKQKVSGMEYRTWVSGSPIPIPPNDMGTGSQMSHSDSDLFRMWNIVH